MLDNPIVPYLSGAPSPDQTRVLNALLRFLESKEQVFLLKGYAGTGKTFLLKGLVGYLQDKRMATPILAPTGRAAMVAYQVAGREATTIHKHIYSTDKLAYDETTFTWVFQVNRRDINVQAVHFVEEASMISDQTSHSEFLRFGSGRLLTDLFHYLDLPHRKHLKVIFIGDDAQLPPVGMNFSPALDEHYLERTFGLSAQSASLTQVIRQKEGHPVLEFATALRRQLKEGSLMRYPLLHRPPQLVSLTRQEILEQFVLHYDHSFDGQIIIAYSNKKAGEYNKAVRSMIWSTEDELVPGDRLLVVRNVYAKHYTFLNGQFVRLVDVDTILEMRSVFFKVRSGTTHREDLAWRQAVVEWDNDSGQPQQASIMMLDGVWHSPKATVDPMVTRALYIDFKNRNPALKPGTDEFKDKLRSDPYVNAVMVKWGYAVTAHKAQGGEWVRVFVDLDTPLGGLSTSYFRWSYTAVTRTKNVVGYAHGVEIGLFSQTTVGSWRTVNLLPLVPAAWQAGLDAPSDWERELPVQHPHGRQLAFRLETAFEERDLTYHRRIGQFHLDYTLTLGARQMRLQVFYNSRHAGPSNWQLVNASERSWAEAVLLEIKKALMPRFERSLHKPPTAFQEEYLDVVEECAATSGLRIEGIQHLDYRDRIVLGTEEYKFCLDALYNGRQQYTSLIPLTEDLQRLGPEAAEFMKILKDRVGSQTT